LTEPNRSERKTTTSGGRQPVQNHRNRRSRSIGTAVQIHRNTQRCGHSLRIRPHTSGAFARLGRRRARSGVSETGVQYSERSGHATQSSRPQDQPTGEKTEKLPIKAAWERFRAYVGRLVRQALLSKKAIIIGGGSVVLLVSLLFILTPGPNRTSDGTVNVGQPGQAVDLVRPPTGSAPAKSRPQPPKPTLPSMRVSSQLPGVSAELVAFSRFENTLTLKLRFVNEGKDSQTFSPDVTCSICPPFSPQSYLLDETTGKRYNSSSRTGIDVSVPAGDSVDSWINISCRKENGLAV
jgi:hypothetical protein